MGGPAAGAFSPPWMGGGAAPAPGARHPLFRDDTGGGQLACLRLGRRGQSPGATHLDPAAAGGATHEELACLRLAVLADNGAERGHPSIDYPGRWVAPGRDRSAGPELAGPLGRWVAPSPV